MRFEFATATRIVFGAGALAGLETAARESGARRALVVTGRDPARAERALALLRRAGLEPAVESIAGEPTVDQVAAAADRARRAGCELVVGFGGGAALDAGKAIAALATNPGDPLDYLEVIGRGRPLAHAPLAFFAVPTTAGTGAEVTRNAVLASPAHRVKASLRSPLMLPRLALVDPELTFGLPPALTATTGLDALTQLIEPYVSCRTNPLTDALCAEGLRRAAPALRRAYHDGHDAAARTDLALASLHGGLALANAGLGAVHGFAGPIGGRFPAPHGAVCAALLPGVMAANLAALRQRQPGGEALRRYETVARWLTGRDRATADDGVAWVRELVAELAIPRLGTYGVAAADLGPLVEAARQASSMKANPLPLTEAELHAVLAAAR
jgi:alcohol dehydrogenase class IV